MKNNLIDTYSITKAGYDPVLIAGGWQAAFLTYAAEPMLDKIDIHFETDEAFILYEGKAVLVAATVEGENVNFEAELMQPGKIYNIPARTWHAIRMQEGGAVYIVEKANTHLGDFEFHYLTGEQQLELDQLIDRKFSE